MQTTTDISFREPKIAMDLTRLGSLHQTRLSFVRSIIRKVTDEHWQISLPTFELDSSGNGTAIYRIQTQHQVYSCLIFAQALADDLRSDRVIAEAWDITFALIEGEADPKIIKQLKQSVPLQEAGRNNSRVLVLSRANKSVRNFAYIVECLSAGQQPDPDKIAEVGYLYRTTAVYGNGKFGIADFKLLLDNNDFSRPFSAQMFAVYLLRDFCVLQVEHIAKKSSDHAIRLNPELNRYLGIGNSTGLGMAPFLINHPGLLSRWVQALESAITICSAEKISPQNQAHYLTILKKSQGYFSETSTVDDIQQARYEKVKQDIVILLNALQSDYSGQAWGQVLQAISDDMQAESQELFFSILLELFPEKIDYLCDEMGDSENYDLDACIKLTEFKKTIESRYTWTLDYDFEQVEQYYWFWYRSEEKEEPRLGVRGEELGADKEMPLGIAYRVQQLHQLISTHLDTNPDDYIADFILLNPQTRGIIRRVQSMVGYIYPEIHGNLYAKAMRPLDLLRAKLAFFGVSKFDPKSDKWVRVTMFQGAPILDELNQSSNDFKDDWYFPLAPKQTLKMEEKP